MNSEIDVTMTEVDARILLDAIYARKEELRSAVEASLRRGEAAAIYYQGLIALERIEVKVLALLKEKGAI